MRKLLSVLFVLMLVGSFAGADIVCTCSDSPCICFLQSGDQGPAVEGLCKALKAQNYLAEDEQESVFSLQVTSALTCFQGDHNLPQTGMADDTTLAWLLWNMSPDDLSKLYPDLALLPMRVAVSGGKRAHQDETCNYNNRFEMRQPRLVSLLNVYKLGVRPCAHCSAEYIISE